MNNLSHGNNSFQRRLFTKTRFETEVRATQKWIITIRFMSIVFKKIFPHKDIIISFASSGAPCKQSLFLRYICFVLSVIKIKQKEMAEALLAGWLRCRSKMLGHLPAVMPQKVTSLHPTPPKHLKMHDAKKLHDQGY